MLNFRIGTTRRRHSNVDNATKARIHRLGPGDVGGNVDGEDRICTHKGSCSKMVVDIGPGFSGNGGMG